MLGSSVTLLISSEPLASRAPDFMLCWRKNIVRDKNDVLCSPPELIVEVLSPSETKRPKQAKLGDYARIGVPEVWIVSPEAQSVEIHLLGEGKFTRQSVMVEGELQPTQFPQVSVPIDQLRPE